MDDSRFAARSTTRRRLPANAKRIAHHRGRGAAVYIGAEGWATAAAVERAGVSRLISVLPSGDNPSRYDWSPYRGREAVVSYWCPDDRRTAAAVAVALIQAGALLAVTMDHAGDDPMRSYRPAPALERAA